MRIGIFGAGGFGRELIRMTQLARDLTFPGAELVFFDDSGARECLGIPVITLAGMAPGDQFVIAVGNGRMRENIEARCLAAGLEPASIYDASASIGPDVEIAPGAVLCGNSIVTASARIGRQFQCNIYSYVAHDCAIGDYVTFAPRVNCNGNVHIGNYAYVGTGAVIRQGTPDKPLVIGEGATVGMGAVVTKDVPPGATVIGNPARPMPARRSIHAVG